MALEKPETGIDIEFGNDFAFSIRPSRVGNMRDTIHHKHVGRGQLCITRPEHFSAAAAQQVITIERTRSSHWRVFAIRRVAGIQPESSRMRQAEVGSARMILITIDTGIGNRYSSFVSIPHPERKYDLTNAVRYPLYHGLFEHLLKRAYTARIQHVGLL